MAEQESKVKCPLCEGRGELLPSAIAETFATPELRKRLDARIAEIAESCSTVLTGAKGRAFNFEKEVHHWNPTLPIWRRSPKE